MMLVPATARANAWESAIALLDRIGTMTKQPTRAAHLETGLWGEEAALFHLRRQGFIVIAQDWSTRKAPGDLDLVAWENDSLCFVEVKTRSSRAFATAESAVDAGKRRSLRRMARHYLKQFPEGTATRFDVLAVYRRENQPAKTAEFELFRNAFGWTD